MKLSPLALALTLAVPASASSYDDFASSLSNNLIGQAKAYKGSFKKPTTQETDSGDPRLLAQKYLIDMIRRVEPSVVYLRMTIPMRISGPRPKLGIAPAFYRRAAGALPAEIITTNSHCVERLAVGAEIEVGLYEDDDNNPVMTKGKILAYGNSDQGKDIAFVELLDTSLNRPPCRSGRILTAARPSSPSATLSALNSRSPKASSALSIANTSRGDSSTI